jgi:hypothetical protein
MVAFAGRVEARMTVPAGGAAASVSTGAHSSAVTVTTPAANYFHTSAGGVSSWATTFQTQLNDNVTGYPTATAAVQSMLGYGGAWTSGSAWLCNETSGNLAPTIGATTLTATTLTYASAGAIGIGTQTSIGFSAGTSRADGGNIHNVTATDDLVVMWIGYVPSVPAGIRTLITKMGAAGAGWQVNLDNGSQSFYFQGSDAGSTLFTNIGASLHVGVWHVGIACVDRSTGKARVGTRAIGTGTNSVVAESTVAAASMSNAQAFRVGDRSDNPGVAPTGMLVDAVYVVSGSGVASGLSTNLATALSNFASAINSSWSVAMSTTTGRYTISHSFWPIDIAWTSTTQRDLAGFDADVTYPATAAQMATAVGYGTWSTGWLMNDSSGTLVDAFAAANLTVSFGTAVYANQGARGGNDKAISFDTGTDQFSAGDVLDAEGDLVLAWVARFDTAGGANGDILGKGWGTAAAGQVQYILVRASDGVTLFVQDSAGGTYSSSASGHINEWHVGIAVLDRVGGVLRVGTQALTTGTQSLGTSTAFTLPAVGNAQNFVFGSAGAYGAAMNVKVSALYAGFIGTGLSANLSTALSNFASYMKSQTGTECAEGVFFPDCPLNVDGDPTQAPRVTDLRQSEGPTGIVLGLAGNSKYRFRNLRYEMVPRAQVWETAATYANGSWEHFLKTTQFGMGHSWFTPSSRCQFYWESAGSTVLLGSSLNSGSGAAGWFMKGITSCEPPLAQPPWTGYFNITIPEIVSDG